MKNDIQQTVQAKFCSKLGPKKVRGNATYKYVFPKTQCYEDFSVNFLYNMTYIRSQKLIEIYFTFKRYR